MAGRFQNPFPQFFDATPEAYSGAKLFFYAAGTSTKQNTYSDKGLTSANTNPVVLNSAGRPAVEIWLQDLDYKVVLAPSTDTDPPTSPIWSSDYVRARDSALVAKTLTGSGSPNGSVAGTAGSASILPDFYWDYTSLILYICTTTGTTSTAVWTAINAATAANVVTMPQGYLTLVSATPVITSDQVAATSVYYTPDQGQTVPIYNGSSMIPTGFSQLTLTLSSSHTALNIYDVYVFSNGGVVTIGTGPTWSAGTGGSITAGSCARGTGVGGAALARVNGIYTNAVQITARNGSTTYTVAANQGTYVGSLFMDGSNGQITCHRSMGQSRKFGVWNAYNRRPITMLVNDSTATWAYGTATIRASNGSSSNSATVFCGLAEEEVRIDFVQCINGNTSTGNNGIGWNSTTAFATGSKKGECASPTASIITDACATYTNAPALGINVVSCLETTNGSSVTFRGGSNSMLMTARYRG